MPSTSADRVFELRNYTTNPGQRDVLIDLFEREFIESQEVLGAHVVATFRNLDDPDRFVWVRSFADMSARAATLDGFYTGPVWQTHRSAANATIADSDNVLLLRTAAGSLARDPATRRPIGATAIPSTLIVATTYALAPGGDEMFAAAYARDVAPHLRERGIDVLATFSTEHAANSYPRLPVRENETVFVAFARFESVAAYAAHAQAMRTIEHALAPHLSAPTQTLRLQPTARSLLR